MAETPWLVYRNSNATRSLPLSDRLTSALGYLPGMGLSVEVFSGGQPTAGNGARVGSVRHDHGDAADVFFYRDGNRLDWSREADVPIFQEIVRQGRANGLTGFGAGPGYMRPGSMHVGFGSPGVWGAGGRGENAAPWLRQAYYGGPAPRPNTAVAAIGQLAPLAPSPRRPGAIMSYAPIATARLAPATAPVRPVPPMMAASAPQSFATAFEKTAASGFGSDYRDPYSRSTSISSI